MIPISFRSQESSTNIGIICLISVILCIYKESIKKVTVVYRFVHKLKPRETHQSKAENNVTTETLNCHKSKRQAYIEMGCS